MSWGCRHNSSVVIQRYDGEGVVNVLRRRAAQASDERLNAYYMGASNLMEVCLNHEWDTQEDFFLLFDMIGGVKWDG